VKREIIIRLRGNDSASRPGPFKRLIMAAAGIAIAFTILMAILLLGLSLILIIWGMIAITLLTAIVKAVLRDDSMKRP
jgi:D-alanyl-lipoteichoic acid acyltransferase DltB (MBOAT superfamily)